MAQVMGVVVSSLLVGLTTVAAAQPAKPVPAKPAPAPPPQRATGLICNEGATGNRGVWLEIDSHSMFATSITLGAVGALDADFNKKFFPDHPRGAKQPTATSVSLAVQQGTCMPDESAGAKALVSCTAADATAPTATLTYYVEPDELTVRRSIAVTNVKLDVLKSDAGVALAISFDAVVRKKKVKYTFTKTFGALQTRRGPNDSGAPAQGCAVTAGVSVKKLS